MKYILQSILCLQFDHPSLFRNIEREILNWLEIIKYKIRDLFEVKLNTIRSETNRKREREKKTYVNPSTDRGIISDPN